MSGDLHCSQNPSVWTTLVEKSLVWDNHGCMPLRANDTEFLPQLKRYKDAGVNVVTINVGFDALPWSNTALVAETYRRWIHSHPKDYMLIESITDINVAKTSGRLGICFDIEGGSALNGSLGMLENYYNLGVRWMLIAYNRNNALGGGCQDDDAGLTDFGKAVLDEMARVGMVVCCSHTGYRTTMEVMEHSPNPVIFSHSNPFGLWEHKRNIRDDQIRACAKTGGVIGINGIGIFIGENDATTESFVRHIDYVVQLVGPQHVGISLDYCFDHTELNDYLSANPDMFPPELGYSDGINMVEPEQFPEIADTLLGLGYTDDDVRLILGENHLRIAEQVWR